MRALEGIRIIEWSAWQLGPAATCMLGELGAEIIKLEEPGTGDPTRGYRRVVGVDVVLPNGRNAYFEINNWHKKSVAVDLKKESGRQIVYKLVEKSDVFVHNYRPSVVNAVGLDYETLRRRNPKLIYASNTGYGAEGPDSDKPSYDYLGQARSGIMWSTGEPDSPPERIEGGVTDQIGAVGFAYAILAALVARERHGIGQKVETSILGSMLMVMAANFKVFLLVGTELRRQARKSRTNPLWNHYQCADGKWIALAMMQSQRYWPHLCKAINAGELAQDPRFETEDKRRENCEALVAALDLAFNKKTREQWIAILKENQQVIWEVVNDIPDLLTDEQMLANKYVMPFDHPVLGNIKVMGSPIGLSETPLTPVGVAPELGQHTEQVLMDVCGYDWAEINRLKEQGAIP